MAPFNPYFNQNTLASILEGLNITNAQLTSKTDVITGFGNPQGQINAINIIEVPSNRTLTINGQTYDLAQNRSWIIPPFSSPLTTKGDLYTFSTEDAALPIGPNGYFLSPNSAQTSGLNWVALTSAMITAALGFTPVTNARTITINGSSQDLSTDIIWNVGTVTSIGISGSDFGISNSPITANGVIGLTLAISGVTAATYGSATQVPVFAVDAKGRITSVTNTTITGIAPSGSAGGDLSGSYPNPTIKTTWAGNLSIATVGTITSGTWQGTAIGDTYISSASTWNGKQAGSSILTALSALSYTSTAFVKMTGATTFALDTSIYLTSNQTITLGGDLSGSGTTSITATIGNNTVTLAKMAAIATASILGRNTVGTGNVEVLSATTTKSLLSLNNVENTALSTWAGSTNITTLGTIAGGLNVTFTQNTANTPLAVITNNGTGNSSVLAVNAGSTGNPNIGFQVSGVAKGTFGWNISANTISIGNLVYSTNDFGFKMPSDGSLQFVDPANSSAQRFLLTAAGKVKIGTSTPTALLHIAAGTASANTAPLKLTLGTNLTTAEIGAVEYNGTNFYATRGGPVREFIWTGTSGVAAPSTQALLSLPLNVYGAGTITSILGTPDGWATINDGGTLRKVPYYN